MLFFWYGFHGLKCSKFEISNFAFSFVLKVSTAKNSWVELPLEFSVRFVAEWRNLMQMLTRLSPCLCPSSNSQGKDGSGIVLKARHRTGCVFQRPQNRKRDLFVLSWKVVNCFVWPERFVHCFGIVSPSGFEKITGLQRWRNWWLTYPTHHNLFSTVDG